MNYKSNKGFTLVELVVVMLIFIVVIVLSSQAFEHILTDASQEGKKAESNIQGVVGLELMRTDIEHAGYGLPWVLSTPATFKEMSSAANSLAAGIDSTTFNDSALTPTTIDANKVPRAFQSGKSTSTGIDYLVVKSVVAGLNGTAKKWAFVKYSGTNGANSYIKKWNSADDLASGDNVITINSAQRQLIVDSSNKYYYAPTISGTNPVTVPSGFAPAMNTDIYLTYGVDTVALRMPYNRADYYVKVPSSGISKRCAPGTGNLYKGTTNHTGGGVTQNPLLDCIADMQVVYSLDTNGDGLIDLHVDESGISQLSAQDIRSQVKEVRVYILTHEGKADRNYSYPSQTITVGEFGSGRTWNENTPTHDLSTAFGANWRNYRWKVYKMVVIPRNLSL
jgi:prepilin-type N-terminal cleavage/methylation domain-containing protein